MSAVTVVRLRDIFKHVASDTAVYFGLGDTTVSATSAELSGVALNGVSAAAAIVGSIATSVTGKNVGLGFRSAALVSAYTVGSIVYRGVKEHGLSCMKHFNLASGGIILPVVGWGAWTVANLLQGFNEAHAKKPTGVLDNPQTYFCIGSAAIAGNNPLSTLLFMGALAKAGRTEVPDDAETTTWKEFVNKHLTTKRLRAVSYGVSAALATMTAIVNPISALGLFPVAYGLFTAGNIFFDKGKNKSFFHDLGNVISAHRGGPKILLSPRI